jgi:hypothetical protein
LIVKIFKVSRPEGDKVGYDEYDSFVCVAPDEETARRLHPRHYHVWVETTGGWHWKDGETGVVEQNMDKYHSWTCDIDALVVEEIGSSPQKFFDGVKVILASYHAG